jgi:hypothetical protein
LAKLIETDPQSLTLWSEGKGVIRIYRLAL